MKVLASIPTRRRNTAGAAADVLAEVADRVIIVSQEARVSVANAHRNIEIREEPDGIGLARARNIPLEIAAKEGYDIVIQSDDDEKYDVHAVEAMVRVLAEEPYLGMIAVHSRQYMFFRKAITCTKPWLIDHCTNLWAIRTDAYLCAPNREGELGFDPRAIFADDVEYSLRLWKHGIPHGRVHDSTVWYNALNVRYEKTDDSGGLKPSDRKAQRPVHAQFICNTYPRMISSATSCEEDGAETLRFRLNWDEVLRPTREKFKQGLGYEDSKGRKL